MTHSALATETRWTHQKSSRDGARIDRFIIHHAANTSVEQTLNLFAGAREVSAHYALGNGRVVACVPEEERAWTSGSYAFDRRAVTVEVSNSRAGDPWPVADIEFDHLARLIADVSARHGFDINDDTVLTHQELYTRFGASYATACPGDLQRRKAELIALARHYRGQGAAPAPSPSTPSTAAFPARERYGAAWVVEIQKKLIRMGHDLGPDGADGLDGPRTQAVVLFEQGMAPKNGFRIIDQDGIAGPDTNAYLDWWLARTSKPSTAPATAAAPAFPLPAGWYFGPQEGPTESVSGHHGNSEHLRTWQQQMRNRGWIITPDGLYGAETRSVTLAFQREKGLTADGLIGPATWAAAWTTPITPAA